MSASDVQIIENMTMEQYNAESGYGDGLWLRRGMIANAITDIQLFHDLYVNPVACVVADNAFTGNKATDFGTVFEQLVDDEKKYELYPETTFRKAKKRSDPDEEIPWKLGTEHASKWCASIKKRGLVAIDSTTEAKAKYIHKRFVTNRVISAALDVCDRKQLTLRWVDTETGLRLQTRPDRVSSKRAWACDIKTILHMRKWETAVEERRYDIQEVMAKEPLAAHFGEVPRFTFLTAEKSIPYISQMTPIHPDILEDAAKSYRLALVSIKEKRWELPRSDEIREPKLPAWWHEKHGTFEGTGSHV